MKVAEEYARTAEEAKKMALDKLGVKEGDSGVEVEILDEGSKGVFGWGNKFARVRVLLKDGPEDKVENVLYEILRHLELTGDIEKEYKDENLLRLNVVGGDMGLLIGKRGQTLDAMQFLLNLISNKDRKEKIKIVLDVEGYRQRRERSLQELAKRLAEKVRFDKKNVALEPMMSNERRIIHLTLQDDPYVETFSQGEEPMRKVVIALKK
jgi:Predicted RNA-binding protein